MNTALSLKHCRDNLAMQPCVAERKASSLVLTAPGGTKHCRKEANDARTMSVAGVVEKAGMCNGLVRLKRCICGAGIIPGAKASVRVRLPKASAHPTRPE